MALTGASGPVQFSHLLYVVSLICCAEAIQLALSSLSRGISLNIGVHSMCSWAGANSASPYTTVLDPLECFRIRVLCSNLLETY